MHILLAPDSFKGALTAADAARAMARGARRALGPDAQLTELPLSDGGEGLVPALVAATGGTLRRRAVSGPRGEPVEALWGILGDGRTAVIEMAAASGLPLLPPEQRDPSLATTRGTGQLIAAALDAGCRRLIVGIGGSATNDAGVGMAQALGAGFFDRDGAPLGPGGAELLRLHRIDISGLDPRLAQTQVTVACDVDNPLTGPRGAAAVYGPQKGADPDMVKMLDAALARFAHVVQRQLGLQVDDVPGAGAAGGLGAGLVAFLRGELRSGIELVLDAVDLDQHLARTDLVLTGEGKLDLQSLAGKVPVGVARRARARNTPVVALAGALEGDVSLLREQGITACFSITPGPLTLEEAMAATAANLASATEQVLHLYRLVTLPG